MVNIQNVIYIRQDKTCVSFDSAQKFWTWQTSGIQSQQLKVDLSRYQSVCAASEAVLEYQYNLPTGSLANIHLIFITTKEAERQLQYPETLALFADPSNTVTLHLRSESTRAVAFVHTDHDSFEFVTFWDVSERRVPWVNEYTSSSFPPTVRQN